MKWQKEYSCESSIDIEQDVSEAIEFGELVPPERDKYGFWPGKIIVTLEYIKD